ncbi:LysR substrate-binding domain-containing protein [Kocuria rhizophila]|uniref:LysR substrate-binding domain-containing protein n=1 Tax=Kocuria rhizophila TaxID=72000 RepID=UPI001EF71379|nr:LysR substrate-binding domain-containing protein [Kocuria rhizophila]MCG7423919.1 LysR substrate-binding domain-containing protein [Kocuria rhizophila]
MTAADPTPSSPQLSSADPADGPDDVRGTAAPAPGHDDAAPAPGHDDAAPASAHDDAPAHEDALHPGDPEAAGPFLTVGYVPGVMPGKWLGRWRQRRMRPVLRDELLTAAGWRQALDSGEVTACFVRLDWSPEDPDPDHLRTTHHAVHLYDELQVAVLSTDDVLGVLDSLTTAQLAEESTPQAHADIDDAAMAVELAAAGVGPVVLPMSVARLHARKDVTHRELTDAPTVPVFLVWPRGLDEDMEGVVQRFVGIVRGRKESSGRDDGAAPGQAASSGGEGRPSRAMKPAAAEKSQEKEPATRSGKAQSGGWAKAGASTKPGLRRKPGRKVKNSRSKKRR